ncbi:MAG: hypothetical protein ACHQ7M_14540, partial [Chloroflexota bacterium]
MPAFVRVVNETTVHQATGLVKVGAKPTVLTAATGQSAPTVPDARRKRLDVAMVALLRLPHG